MIYDNRTRLPGCVEHSGLYDKVEDSLYMMVNMMETQKVKGDPPIIIFSDPPEYGRGTKLFNYIRRHKIGQVFKSDIINNPNSKNDLQIFMFLPDYGKLQAVTDEIEKKREEKAKKRAAAYIKLENSLSDYLANY